MATYTELYALKDDTALKNKIQVACVVAAEEIRTEPSNTAHHLNRQKWASRVFANPEGESDRMLWAVLAANRTFTVGQIQGATDSAIQTAVNDAVNVFAQQE